MSLEEYNKKRDFNRTAEPEGKNARNSGPLKFVVQRHAASRLHYDFRLEMEGVLKSWAVPKGPSLNPKDKRLAMMVEDHPFAYRTFEGSIPAGSYGAGEVEIWDQGTYEPLLAAEGRNPDAQMLDELNSGSLKFIMHGEKLRGEFALVKIKNADEDNSWLLIKHRDDFAQDQYDAEKETAADSKVTAYLAQKKSKKISEKPGHQLKTSSFFSGSGKKLTTFTQPMLADVATEAFSDENWVFEIKWDGYRALADLRQTVQLYSRNGLSFNEKFKKIVTALRLQPHEMILDGEIVAYDAEGKPSFQLLQQIAEHPNVALTYQVFDLLWLNGHSTQNLSLIQRKELLKDALIGSDIIKYHDHIVGKGKDFFAVVKKMGLEGMIAKKADSPYVPAARNGDWLKIKTEKTEDVLICGFTEPRGSRKRFGSLLLGRFEGNKIHFCGHTGTGFSDKKLTELYARMQPLISEEPPFDPVPKTNEKPTWLRPELVAEIKFTELTAEGIFRHPVFLRLREHFDTAALMAEPNESPKPVDKPIKKGKLTEEFAGDALLIGEQKIIYTNPAKIYFPNEQVSKLDVINYYQSMAEYILPHLRGRPQSMNRFPNGINGMSFYQKDASTDVPGWIETERVFSASNEKYINYMLCNDRATMAYMNNLGCIEFNVWTSRVPHLDRPDYLVLDLDPSENNSFDEVILTAQTIKKILDEGGVTGYCKTSGSTGLHIYIPMGAEYTFEQVKNFAHLLMTLVQQELPDFTTLERALQRRSKDKIYLDYLQNRQGQTLASVYSLRPKNGAPVSMPLDWDEVKTGLKPTDFNIENALQRVMAKGDFFLPTLDGKTDMAKFMEQLQE